MKPNQAPQVDAGPTPQAIFAHHLRLFGRAARFGTMDQDQHHQKLVELFQMALDTPAVPPEGTIEYRATLGGILFEARNRLPEEEYGEVERLRGMLDALHGTLKRAIREFALRLKTPGGAEAIAQQAATQAAAGAAPIITSEEGTTDGHDEEGLREEEEHGAEADQQPEEGGASRNGSHGP